MSHRDVKDSVFVKATATVSLRELHRMWFHVFTCSYQERYQNKFDFIKAEYKQKVDALHHIINS